MDTLFNVNLSFSFTEEAKKALDEDPPFDDAWPVPTMTVIPAPGDHVGFGDGIGPMFRATDRVFMWHAPDNVTVDLKMDLNRRALAEPPKH